MASEAAKLEVPGPHGVREMRVSSPGRVIWPESGTTKLQLAEYLVAVAEPFLRHDGGRPISLQRYPGDISSDWFFSKNPPKGAPDWIRTATVAYPSGRRHPQLVVDEIAAAVWMAQMNTLVFHPWPATAEDSDHPDQLRLDLDPQPGRGYADAVEVALVLRGLLQEVGLEPVVKTSGNRGLHVVAAIRPEHDYIEVRHAVIAVARELERRLPDDVTTSWWKEERGERIFIDYNQAARDRTTAGAYSPRATPGATVSTPLAWDELPGSDPAEHTIATVPARLASLGDPWEGWDAAPGSIRPLLEWWERDAAAGLGELVYPPDYPKMPGEPPRVAPSRAKKD
ncbi:non-homologous end-joining DNA ligase [Homoserinibacter sp. YIM 151385]|uniref:non-homologous end-joining DNA ligase n=1 Tax=Homoserinibacter sp. YIM 151385 TaxID=2985506 RepID=UPI0022F1036C|nr:non-homologous end-joining DNA ligase [Homoserinibacter sp. YIM 151385]WBU37623.1 non-homologous end-joining DNA ligase [Homoserinibacter sp. YIM 151385]